MTTWSTICRAASAAAMVVLPTLTAVLAPRAAAAQDPFVDAVHSLSLGTNGGFGEDLLPDIILGPPRGAGQIQGSFDVLALGVGGSIVLRFDDPVVCDGDGVDFTIFENAFHNGSPTGPIFDELAYVAVSQDGETFFEFPFDAETKSGLAGRIPVLSHPDNGIDPTDPEVSGGDSFDLSAIGIEWARYVRITDVAGAIRDVGDLPPFLPAPNAGFDLDAVAAVNVCDGAATATPTHTPLPDATPTDTPLAAATATYTAQAPSPTASPPDSTVTATAPTPTDSPPTDTPTPDSTTATPAIPGDVDGNGTVDGDDVAGVIGAIFSAASFDPRADINGDLRVDAADVTAVTALRGE